MRKKVGIITYHFALNYGAVLQCFALKEYLVAQGYDVEVLNYVTVNQRKNNEVLKENNSVKKVIINFLLLPFKRKNKIKYNKFIIFINNKMNLSKLLSTKDELIEYIRNKKFDFIISGSDQVWNSKIKDFDEAFFLPWNLEASKLAYAASIGNATKDDLQKFCNAINDFNYISIREESSIAVLKNFTNKELISVCDPVMLLSKKEWKSKFQQNNMVKEPYVLCYFLHKECFKYEYRIVKQISKILKLKIIIINARYSKYSLNKNVLFSVGPDDFLNLFSNASFVCTDSFHGIVFSMIFQKRFIAFAEKENSLDRRREEILKRANLTNRLMYCNKQYDLNKIIESNSILDSKFEKYINSSKKFLGEMNERRVKIKNIKK